MLRFSVYALCYLLLLRPCPAETWRFVAVGDGRGSGPGAEVSPYVAEMCAPIISEAPDLVIYPGDLVIGYPATEAMLGLWRTNMAPIYDAGIAVYPVMGNHDRGSGWDAVFDADLPDNGPPGEMNRTYSFVHKNALFIGLDSYVRRSRVNQAWLNAQLATNQIPHVFAFAHEMAFKIGYHSDCLDDYAVDRDTFWNSLIDAGSRVYFDGHDHYFDHAVIDDGDGWPHNDMHQFCVGGGGASPQHSDMPDYDGNNTTWTPRLVYHEKRYGYVVVDVDGFDVKLTWKRRMAPGVYEAAAEFSYNLLDSLRTHAPDPADGAVDIPLNASLSWAAAPSGVTYDFYFGTNRTAVATADTNDTGFAGSLGLPSYSPAGLECGNTYYWRVDARQSWGSATGQVWRITTLPLRPLVTNPAARVAVSGVALSTNVAAGSIWRYWDQGTLPAADWNATGFDDSSWSAGAAQLGYGDGDEAMVVDYGPYDTNKHVTTYFRRAFEAAGVSAAAVSRLRILRDDGAVVYLNGTEVHRSWMPTLPVSNDTYAAATVSSTHENMFFETQFASNLLVSGTNVLAVEIHQDSPDSSDVSFDLQWLTEQPVQSSHWIDNGATDIEATVAVLNGTLASTGAAPTEVFVLWGLDEAGTNAAAWANTNFLGWPSVVGALTTRVDNLATFTTYHYRFYATNTHGAGWAPASGRFKTLSNLPIIRSDPPSGITTYSATLRGNLISEGTSATTVFVFWGTNDGQATSAAWAHTNLVDHVGAGPVSASVTGLSPATEYFYRFCATNSYGADWGDSSVRFNASLDMSAWAERLKISFPGYDGTERLSGFPALLRLGPHVPGFSYALLDAPAGGDLRFTSADGTVELPYEVEQWNTGGTSIVWVELVALSGRDTHIWAYLGNTNATHPAYSTNGATWGNGYAATWHLQETSGPHSDSTIHGNTGTPAGGVLQGVAGMVGGADWFDGIDAAVVAANSPSLNPSNAITLSAWIRPERWDLDNVVIRKDQSYRFYNRWDDATNSAMTIKLIGSVGDELGYDIRNFETGRWYYVAGTYDQNAPGSNMVLYVNGQQVAAKTSVGALTPTTDDVFIGMKGGSSQPFKGLIDEARISNVARSGDWIRACWLNQFSNTAFCAYAAVDWNRIDVDGDGMPERWEEQYFGSAGAADAYSDTDHDGFLDVEEYGAGTHPTNPASLLQVESVAVTPEGVIISFSSESGRTYTVQYQGSLLSTNWLDLTNDIPGSGGAVPVADLPDAIRFYRVKVTPQE